MTLCPCGSGLPFDDCCSPIMNGAAAETALELMRARYTAFARKQIGAFLLDTLAPESRDDYEPAEIEQSLKNAEAKGLEIREVVGGGANDESGIVEFVAHFVIDGKPAAHHERGRFRREAGRWVYVDGDINPKPAPRQVAKIGRNEPCPCGSGKKYKKCCGG